MRLYIKIVLILSDSLGVILSRDADKVGFALILSFVLIWFVSTVMFLYGIFKVRVNDGFFLSIKKLYNFVVIIFSVCTK